MRTIRSGDGLDGVNAYFIVDDLHFLSLTDSDGAGVHPEEDAVLDGDLVRLLHHHTTGRKVTEGGGLHHEELHVADTNLWRISHLISS